MLTFELIMEQLKAADVDTFMLPKKELKALPEVLMEGEMIRHLVQGMYSGGIGVLCATNKRLVFVDKGLFFGLKVEEFPLRTLSSVSHETGVMMAKIKIFASGNNAEITHVDKMGAKAFVVAARELIDGVSNSSNNSNAEKSEVDILDRLERLLALRDKGGLSDNEFQSEKSKLMGK